MSNYLDTIPVRKRAVINVVIVERSAVAPNDRIPEYQARVWRDEPRRLEFAGGASEVTARTALEQSPCVILLEDIPEASKLVAHKSCGKARENQ